ncbi:MAG: IS110 family transposase [Pseudonocardiaceae bacterium]|nr:MAG: IS110 family transposase [Pseudonocardiaceae bacterium]
MGLAVGIDVAKLIHWVVAVDDEGHQVLSRRCENSPAAIATLIDDLDALTGHGPVTVAVDMLGGIASVLTTMLIDSGLNLVHTPGLLVNRSRRATPGGERKSDPADAKVIADQVRLRAATGELRRITPVAETDAALRLLVSRRADLVADRTRRLARLRDLLTSINPGLERAVDPTTKSSLWLLSRFVTADEIRRAGLDGLTTHMRELPRLSRRTATKLIDAALAAATAQHVQVPGETVAADILRELAAEITTMGNRITAIETQIAQAVNAHPDGTLVRSLPGMGTTLPAEFLAAAGGLERFPTPGALASAAGLAPVLQQSGKMNYLRRSYAGNRTLKRVFYQSAFCALQHDQLSRAFYDRKRKEGKRHHQALIALARRRINVLHAMLRTRTEFHAPTTGLTAA